MSPQERGAGPQTPRGRPADSLESFWQQLLQVVGPSFSGSIMLHCALGNIMKYEIHQVHRPRGSGSNGDEGL